MPELISVSEFLDETKDDFNSPTTSSFVSKIPMCKNSVANIEENLDIEREGLIKMKKSLKAIHASGNTHYESEILLSRALERLGNGALNQSPDSPGQELGQALIKFSIVTKELSNLKKTLMQNLQNMLLFPMDSLLKGDIRGVKGELKRPFEKALKDYEVRHTKLEKEKKAQARDAGMFRKEVTPAEIADETEKERRILQLHLCDYLIKVNEIRTKKGVELIKHFVEYYHALNNYFQDGLKTMEQFGSYVNILTSNLTKMRQKQDDEKRKLNDMRNLLRTTPSIIEKEVQNNLNFQIPVSGSLLNVHNLSNIGSGGSSTPATYSLHQMQGNKSLGVTKIGYLNKKSEGKMRRVWQKRKCAVQDGFLQIFHGDETKAPTKVNLLTCQLKIVSEDKKFFDLVSYNRTYHLMDEVEADEWISVLLNSKDAALAKAFDQKVDNDGLVELTQAILGHVHRLPGNDRCADCDSEKDVTWVSVNLGVMVCIECSGVHRTLGVGISRIQSISLDRVPPSMLVLSVSLGNASVNDILEENLKPGYKPRPNASMDERTDFIRAKYLEKKYVVVPVDQESLNRRVELAIESDDLFLLVRCWAQGAKLNLPFPSRQEQAETPLHLAIYRGYLPIVDFLVQNSGGTDKKTKNGSTPLHHASYYGRTEPAKLLLRAGVDIQVQDNDKFTPLDIARQRGHKAIEDLLLHAMEGKKTLFETVDFDWNLGAEDSTDFSDDEATVLDDPMTTPEKKRRPNSFLVENSPYKINENTRTPGGTSISSVGSIISNKNVKLKPGKRNAPPAPIPPLESSPSNHTRSPSDSLIGKFGLGRLVLPPGEQPVLRKTQTNLQTSPPILSTSQSAQVLQSSPSNPSVFSAVGMSSSPNNNQHLTNIIHNGTKTFPPNIDTDAYKKCRALYDCQADNSDEISFQQGEIILILNERTEDDNWMEGLVLDESSNYERRGMFPVSFVEFLST